MTSGWTGVNVSLSSSDFGGTLAEKSLTLTNAKEIKLSPDGWPNGVDPGEIKIQTEGGKHYLYKLFFVLLF